MPSVPAAPAVPLLCQSLDLLAHLRHVFLWTERVVGDGERMFEVLQQWGHQGAEVRYLLHHQRAPGRGDSGRSRF